MTTPEIDLGSNLALAATAVTEQVAAALPVALPIAAALIGVTIGWRYFRRFIKG